MANLHKIMLIICEIRRKTLALQKNVLYCKQNNEKGGMTMMQWNRAFDDVDDLIFMDCDWNKSDR